VLRVACVGIVRLRCYDLISIHNILLIFLFFIFYFLLFELQRDKNHIVNRCLFGLIVECVF